MRSRSWLRWAWWRVLLPGILLSVCVVVYHQSRRLSTRHNEHKYSEIDSQRERELCINSERWILLIPKGDNQPVIDVPGWRIFILDLQDGMENRLLTCSNCLHVTDLQHLPLEFDREGVVSPLQTAIDFMMRRDAKWIYLTESQERLDKQLSQFVFKSRMQTLMADTTKLFDPFDHYAKTKFQPEPTLYKFGVLPTSVIQTRWTPTAKLEGTAQACSALPVSLPPGVLGLVDTSRHTLVGYTAFWSFALDSNSVATSLWKQRLLWESQESVAIFQPVNCIGIATSSAPKTESNIPVQKIVTFLQNWKCSGNFLNCVRVLTEDMFEEQYLTMEDLSRVKFWMSHLADNGYEFPRVMTSYGNITGYPMIYNAASFSPQSSRNLQNPFLKVCQNYSKSPLSFTQQTQLFEDIVLVIIFNHWAPFEIFNYLDFLYTRYFSKIIYCGETLPRFLPAYRKHGRPVNFLEVETRRGTFGYECMALVLRMGLKVKGYMQMSDDVLINFRQFRSLPRDRFWYQKSIRVGNFNQSKVTNILDKDLDPFLREYWWPWTAGNGLSALKRLWKKFKSAIRNDKNKSITDFLNSIKRNNGHTDTACYEPADIFYVPNVKSKAGSYFLEIFFQNNIYLEIAVPTIMYGLDKKENIIHLNGSYLWYKQRLEYPQYYKPSHHYMHPFKLRGNLYNPNHLPFLCQTYLFNNQ